MKEQALILIFLNILSNDVCKNGLHDMKRIINQDLVPLIALQTVADTNQKYSSQNINDNYFLSETKANRNRYH